ncbi:hypothetical protein FWG86_01775 [Candidatus Saccharibacteria bacterium]|nr:hypothetical protein [Candidatus Saccharibacteria bacterium]
MKELSKSTAIIYIVLRALVIASMIGQLLRGNWNNAFLCLMALILFMLPTLLQKRFKITLPNTLEVIVLFFILSGTLLGEIHNFYARFPHWDTLLHTLNGFLAAGIGFALVDLLNKNSKNIKLSPLYLALAAFCFSMTVGVMWEFFEYSMDKLFLLDTQKDRIVTIISTVELDPEQANNAIVVRDIAQTVLYDADGNVLTTIDGGYLDIGINDTMKDLFVNFIGAVVFSCFGYFYVKNRGKYKFAAHFIPERTRSN